MTDADLVRTCKEKLLQSKAELLNRYSGSVLDLRERETGGDEADQSVAALAENQFFAHHHRLRKQLFEIEDALRRIERGTFGICEETEEPIERERLLTIPWTRLSIEGAELREASTPGRPA